MIPCVFELNFHLSDKNPLTAALVLAMTPIGIVFCSIFLNFWIEQGYRIPMVVSQATTVISSFLYIKAYYKKSLILLLISQFLFGTAGSQIVHRKYIANFVYPEFWMKYNTMLSRQSLYGMIFGPVLYLGMLQLNHKYLLVKHTFILPGYFQSVVGIIQSLILYFYFNAPETKKREITIYTLMTIIIASQAIPL